MSESLKGALSMSTGVFQMQFKAAYIPLLKKADLDASQGKSYRPISNLTVLSKTLKRHVARQLIISVNGSYCLNYNQHTVPIILQKRLCYAFSDIYEALDRGDLPALTLLGTSVQLQTKDLQQTHTDIAE